jgi:hypothetical protein
MANIRTDYATGVLPTPNIVDAQGGFIFLEYLTTALVPALSDTIELGPIPANVQVTDWVIHSDDLDTGTSALTLSLGALNALKTDLGTGSDIWATGLTVAATAVSQRAVARTHIDGTGQGVAKNVALKVTTAANVWPGAGKRITVLLSVRPTRLP